MNWQFLTTEIPRTTADLKRVLLANRHIQDAEHFFDPPHPKKILPNQQLFDQKQFQKALARIRLAIKNQEKVIIYGDYDADGICATAILWRALKVAGLVCQPFIPLRDKHGYGLSMSAIDELIATELPSLIITVDNGIVAHEAVKYAKQQGLDIIITDHHQPEVDDMGNPNLPPADAVVHSSRLCGASVSWLMATAIAPLSTRRTLELAGLATIADQVPLREENRSFAYHGLIALRKTKQVGLQALAEVAKIELKSATSATVGYSLAPRINAMGRLAHGLDALRLLCTDQLKTARKLAALLATTNLDRQEMTLDQYQLAIEQAVLQKTESLIFVSSEHFHEGVVGLIAGKLTEKFAKPAIAVSISHGQAKGSARSVNGVNIIELLRQVRDDLLEVGGHPMAAGFGANQDRIENIKQRLFLLGQDQIDRSLLQKKLPLECALDPALITIETCELINKFAPFGAGNQEPLFGISNLKLSNFQTIGQDQKHLKMLLSTNNQTNQTTLTALYWGNGGLSENLFPNMDLAIAGKLEINEWRGRKQVQIIIKDIQIS